MPYAAAIDNCLLAILGKAVGLPVCRILGAYRDRVRAYTSSQHLKKVEDFIPDLGTAQGDGFTAYKVHPPELADGSSDYRADTGWLGRCAKPPGRASRFCSTR